MLSLTSPPSAGFFDSGVGGLTVVEAVQNVNPDISYHYFGDTARCPYGDRPLDEVKEFALQAVDFLVNKGSDPIVMACNISSSIALDTARQRYPERTILGLINQPLVEEVRSVSDGVVGVIATAGTVKSRRYPGALARADLDVHQQACSPLVPLVEEGHYSGEIVENTLEPLLEPLLEKNMDTLVLGCTHYPLLGPALKAGLPPSIRIIDPGRIMASIVQRHVTPRNGQSPTRQFYTSGDPGSVIHVLQSDFNHDQPTVKKVSISEKGYQPS